MKTVIKAKKSAEPFYLNIKVIYMNTYLGDNRYSRVSFGSMVGNLVFLVCVVLSCLCLGALCSPAGKVLTS